ncbi:hypothetical protein [Mesomycoplasma molare]|uniref:Lumazine-binding domain-containing protein n=1 Tax=Mesomycoplasma molare TaxID=171288 RepID=A0ABY5TWN6_9BACT|nr:hypothetical protein [Mesomycoplasma molare]UWD34001.1 hypothetical protein NX772_02735 [Mesomycoplasma molare]
MENKVNKKRGKKLLAIITLALGGSLLGSVGLAPLVFKNWKEIQYDIVDFQQDLKQSTDSSVVFSFEFNDEQTINLINNANSDISISLVNPSTKSEVLKGVAKYVKSLRKWQFSSNELSEKLEAGKKYEVLFNKKQGNVLSEKRNFNTKNIEDKKYVYTKANVSSFEFNASNSREREIIVNFADEIKSLEGKKAVLKYHYITEGENNELSEIKNEDTKVSIEQAAEIKDGVARFAIKGLQPSRKYVIEYVAFLDQSDDNGIISPSEVLVNYEGGVNNAFVTDSIKLEVSNIEKNNISTNSGQIIVGFLKSNSEPELSLIGKKAVLNYKISGTDKILQNESTIVGDAAVFEFRSKDEKTKLIEGTKYEIVSIEVSDSKVEFKKEIQDSETAKTFETLLALSELRTIEVLDKKATFALDFISQDNKDDLDGSTIEVSLEPFNDISIERQTLIKKPGTDNVYTATFVANDLLQGITYSINQIKLTTKSGQESNVLFNNFYTERDKRSFTTIIGSAEFTIQGFAKTTHNSAKVNLVYNPENAFISGQDIILKYKKVQPASDEIFISQATASGLNIEFNLGGDSVKKTELETSDSSSDSNKLNQLPLDSGATYEIIGVEFKDLEKSQGIGAKIISNGGNERFTTFSTIKSITSSNIRNTSATIAITFNDVLKTITENTSKEGVKSPSGRKAKLIYQVNSQKEGQEQIQSSPISTDLVEITENGVVFELNNLLKGVEYQITGIQFDIELPTFYGNQISSRNDNKFSTIASEFEIKSIEIDNIEETTADVSVSFNLPSDIILLGNNLDIFYKEANNPNSSEMKIKATVDEIGIAKVSISNLLEGKKYVITKVESHINETGEKEKSNYTFIIPNSLELFKTFFTKPAINNIEIRNISENSAEVHVLFTNENLNFINTNKTFKLNYSNSDNVSSFVEKNITKEEFNSKKLIFNISNLNKVTNYTIDKITIDGIEIPRVINFEKNKNNFKTSATSSKVVSLNQIINEDTSVIFELNFDNIVDSFMNTKEVIVSIQEEGQNSNKEFSGIVDNGVLRITANQLEAGKKYNIVNLRMSGNNEENINITFSDSVTSERRFVYTKPLVNGFVFSDINETTANVTIQFADSQNNYDNKHVIISYINKNDNTVNEINTSILSEPIMIKNSSITIPLSSLSKFSNYEITGIKVDSRNNVFEDVALKTGIEKTFSTLALNVHVKSISIENITKNSTKVVYSFNDIDGYLKGRNVTIKYKKAGGLLETQTKDIQNTLGILHADFELESLDEGTKYTIEGLEIENIQNIENDSSQFSTLGVVNGVSVSNLEEQSARVNITFQNEDENRTFNNKSALVRFVSEANGTLRSATAIINDNSVSFNLDSLDKNTKYILQDVLVQLSTEYIIIDLDKEFTIEGTSDRIRNFTTSATSAKVISMSENENSKTIDSASVTFQFDRIIDSFLGDKRATLTYANKNNSNIDIVSSSSVVNSSTNALTFDLNNLEQGAGFVVKSINIDGVSISFENSIVKEFSTLPVLSSIEKIIPQNDSASDKSIGLTLRFSDGLNKLNAKRAQISISSLTSGSQTIYTASENISNNSVSFNLTNLEKNSEFVIEEILVDGISINFASSINSISNEQRKFKTTAKKAIVKNINVVESTKNSVLLAVSFDINEDWYLSNKKVKFKFVKDDEEFETTGNFTINDEGIINALLNNEVLLNEKQLEAGNGYTLREIIIFENNDSNTIIELGNSSVIKTFSTLSTINSVNITNKTESSANVTIRLQSNDNTLVNYKGFISLTSNATGIEYNFESVDNFNSSREVTFNVINLPKNETFYINGISVGSKKSTILEYETSIQESEKSFKTQPTTATITSVNFRWADEERTKAYAILTFDSNIDSFMNGKALKLEYYRTGLNYAHGNDDRLVISKTNEGQDVIVSGSTIQFLLQGRVDSNGAQINNNTGVNGDKRFIVRYKQDDTNAERIQASFKGLIQGSNYIINSITTKDSTENIRIDFASNITDDNKTLKTPVGLFDYRVHPTNGLVEDANSTVVTILGYYASPIDLSQLPLEDIKIRFNDISSGKYETFAATEVRKKTENVWTVKFIGNLKKETRYQTFETLIKNQEVRVSPLYYFEGSTNPRGKEQFSTTGNITTVSSIQLLEKTKNSAKISIDFVPGNENLLRNNKPLVVKYRKVGDSRNVNGTSLPETRINPDTKKLEILVNNLEEGENYEIVSIFVPSLGRQGDLIRSLEHNATIPSSISKRFSTTPVIDQIVISSINERSAEVEVRLQGEVSDLANLSGNLTIAKTLNRDDISVFNSQQDINFDANNKTIRFTLTNLDKNTNYQIMSLSLGDLSYDWKNGISDTNKQFSTTGTTATITNITFSNIVNQEATVDLSVGNIDSYINGKSITVRYQKLDERNELTGPEITSSNATISQNKATIRLNNLENGVKYRIIGFNNPVVAGESQSISFNLTENLLKEFDSYVIVKSISHTPNEEDVIVNVDFEDKNISRIIGKLVIIRINGIDNDFYGTINTNGRASFNIRNLAKETTYSIDTIRIDGNTIRYTSSAEVQKQFSTTGTTATINSISTNNSNNTINTANVKIKFSNKDKYLNTKELKLIFKDSNNPSAPNIESNTIANVILEDDIATATFNLTSSELEAGKRYQVVGAKLNSSSREINFNISNIITISSPETQYFETKVSRPTIESASLTNTTNDEGQENTYLSRVDMIFNDPNNSLNTALLNSWEFKLRNTKPGSNESDVSNIEFVNRSFTRSQDTGKTTITIYIKGNIMDWGVVTNKLQIKYSYFDDLNKTNSIGNDEWITQLSDNNDIEIKTSEDFVTTSLNGIVTTGYDVEFNLKIYDPLNKLTNFGQQNGGYNYTNTDSTRNVLNLSRQTTGNSISYRIKAKKSLLNLTGVSGEWTDFYQNNPNPNDEEESVTPEERRQLQNLGRYAANVYPDGSPINTNLYGRNTGTPNLTKWKFTSGSQDWLDISKAIKKEILWINRSSQNDGMVDIKVRITSGSLNNQPGRNYIIAKILNFDLEDFKIQNQKTLYAKNSSKIWTNYQSPLLTGNGTNFFGTASAGIRTVGTNFNATTGVTDNSGTVLWDSNYNQESGIFKTIIKLPNGHNENSTFNYAIQEYNAVIYALFINAKGELYLFGDDNGKPFNFAKDIKFENNDLNDNELGSRNGYFEFNLKTSGILENQKPADNEKLRFVNLIASPIKTYQYFDSKFLFPLNWGKTSNSYKEIVYKK